jgi:hypothetical protein
MINALGRVLFHSSGMCTDRLAAGQPVCMLLAANIWHADAIAAAYST